MTQTTMFNLGPPGPTVDPLDGFEAWWKLYPKDRQRSNRKCGKKKCQQLWTHHRLSRHKDQIMAALREDIRGIEKGAFAFSPGSNDRMFSFPMTTTWLNPNAVRGARWDRDIDEPEKPKPVRVDPPVVVKPLTAEDIARGRRLMQQAAAKARSHKFADVIDPDGTVVAKGRASVVEGSSE